MIIPSSRVILDLARVNDHARIVDLYQTMAGKLTKVPLTVAALETLRTLAKRFPRDEYGRKAARSLDG